MAIRRISELDQIKISDYLEDDGSLKPETSLSNLVFETSEFQGVSDEVPSYYMSKKMTLADLSSLILAGIKQEIVQIWNVINNIQPSEDGLCAWYVINDWTSAGMPGNTGYFPAHISCTSLTVDNDIHGCAMSARWN